MFLNEKILSRCERCARQRSNLISINTKRGGTSILDRPACQILGHVACVEYFNVIAVVRRACITSASKDLANDDVRASFLSLNRYRLDEQHSCHEDNQYNPDQ